MKRSCIYAAGLVFLLALLAVPASAMTVYTEDFDTDGSGSRYILTGGGGSGNSFFGLNSIGDDVGFTGSVGGDYFAGRDMDAAFAGGANPLTLEIGNAIPISMGGSTGTLDIMLAAASGVHEAGQEFIRIIAIDADTNDEFTLDSFTVNGDSDLESSTFAGTVLGSAFQNLTYDLPASIANLELRIETHSTNPFETVGWDEIEVTVAPEPGTALLLSVGLLALASTRRQRG